MWKEYRTVVFRFLLVPYIVNLVIFSILVCKTVNGVIGADDEQDGTTAKVDPYAFKESPGGNILLSIISLVFAVLHILIELKMIYEYRKAYFYAPWSQHCSPQCNG